MELSNILNFSTAIPSTVSSSTNRTGQNGQNGQRSNDGNNNNSCRRPAAGARHQRPAASPGPRGSRARPAHELSIIISCSHDTMEEVALTIGRLDATDAKKQHVYVHVLEHADPDNVATILRGMFGDQTSNANSSQPTSSALNQRTTTGASSDVMGTLNTSGNSGGGSGPSMSPFNFMKQNPRNQPVTPLAAVCVFFPAACSCAGADNHAHSPKLSGKRQPPARPHPAPISNSSGSNTRQYHDATMLGDATIQIDPEDPRARDRGG